MIMPLSPPGHTVDLLFTTMMILDRINRYDIRVLLWCGKSRHYPVFVQCVRVVSRSGDGYLQVIVPLLLYAMDTTLGAVIVWQCAQGFALERSLYLVLKPSLARRRPPEVLPAFSSIVQASDRFSFPSGHTMAAFLLASILAEHYGSLAYIAYLWASAVACSRVLLGVHFPTDVVAGALLGVGIASVIL